MVKALCYISYNEKVKGKLSSSDDPAYRPIINFDPYQDMIEQFKQGQIYSRMGAQESKEATPKGIIPPSIVLNKGERRPNPFREKKRFGATGPLTLDNIEDDKDEENVDTSKFAEMED
ncbi:hypothetical protein Clacol_005241 [Clathrus columnatus]|uniref:Uncharacterized protein n=1 Tax=Clathrus columnatus TaxID=1419009 RepID=A0AAV5A8R1_9AGAM|nr:hypothetical protein Clacol_005241 [Clathrus columnatus]